MDKGSSSNEWEIDTLLPLPYRIILLLNVGVWLWYVAIQIFQKTRINALSVLGFDSHISTNVDLPRACRLIVSQVTTVSVLAYTAYALAPAKSQATISMIDWVPLLAIGAIFYFVFFHVSTTGFGKRRLRSTASRMLAFGINPSIRNNEILLSDTFTSYAKVILDLLIYVCHLFIGTTCFPVDGKVSLDRTYGSWYGIDSLIVAYPTAIRLVQCLHEYEASDNTNLNHLYNAIKYSTSFLPLVAGIMLKGAETEEAKKYYFRMWLAMSLVNSCYTFFWDVTHDWNFKFFNYWLKNDRSQGLLRPVLHFGDRQIYFTAIVVDFILRFIWLTRLLPSDYSSTFMVLTSLYSSEYGVFVLELLEIGRRFMWMLIRVETEWVKMEATTLVSAGDSSISLLDLTSA
ncbi:hypothetical protein BABINDRAFT_160088 [Babjeviella inositovora NRRL Y-12698]|uniref:EXS domain-containing protein n=1 Tax=Babjeviella inositovora NRRL Y-12698 TaxID=984486 RepID=A0A1E3QXU7_9ASCO|nr:uncharacterized protein BABINDRAFT_160088 [Babjeviella inositovora NRRL Y-12698]ODQ81857.1 hypothetical protein BABINDRAFT_160088 [Babjeviella inositovora NRRL Y-12698]